VSEVSQADKGQETGNPLPNSSLPNASYFQRKRNVGLDGAPGEQRWLLEYQPNLAPWSAVRLTVKLDRAGGGGEQPCDDPQEC